MLLRTILAGLLVSTALAGGPAASNGTALAEQGSPALRFVVTAKPGTVQVGRPSQIDLEMYAPNGAKVPAKADTLVTLTLTTLPTLDAARKEGGASSPAKPVSLEKQQFTLPAGVSVRRITGIFPRGEGDVEFTVIAASPGRVRVFAESVGIEPGSALFAVSDRVYVLPKARPPRGDIQWVSLREQDTTRVRLVIENSGADVFRRDGALIQKFLVGLETEAGGLAAPESDLAVSLQVDKGRFEPRSITIPANESFSRDQAELRSSLGGPVEIRARSRVPEIAEARLKYTFEPGLRTTNLVLKPGALSALANGLDEIPITVQAVYQRPGERPLYVPAEQEEMKERVVIFEIKAGKARFVEGRDRITIPKNESSGTVLIVGVSPSESVVIAARSSNGLAEEVTGETPAVAFYLPWWQLLCAAIGGLLLPAINRKPPTTIALGGLGGVILYLFIFFGAVATGLFNIGPWAVKVTKLPSENVLAAGVLGLIGYLSTQKAFDLNKGRSKPKPA